MNEIEQKEIEEIKKILIKPYKRARTMQEDYINREQAEALYNAGYRNCKDKVVLSKEEYQNDFSSQFNKGYEKGSKETAREIFKFVNELDDGTTTWLCLLENLKEFITEQYEVEVE